MANKKLIENLKTDLNKLTDLYDIMLDGTDTSTGMIQCIDPYFNGCWEENMDEIAILRSEINKKLAKLKCDEK